MSFFFFFFFNNEERIGFKKLTNADLGFSSTSNQTHIGLYGGVLEFLDDSDVVKSAMLIYDNYCDILNCSFDRIKTPDGKYRSPKIKVGKDVSNSIVYKIREFAKNDINADWYLAWTGLESKELVFWLIKGDSEDYNVAKTFFSSEKHVLDQTSPSFEAAKKYLLNRINFVSVDLQKDIEVKSQIGDVAKIYKRKDIENAEKLFRETGRAGEELVAQYLENEVKAGRINTFVWENKSKESGLPYDFIVNDKQFIDVKSTRFDFGQYIYFSNTEIDFVASSNRYSYSVFRVFDMIQEKKKLCICNDCIDYMQLINGPIVNIQNEMKVHNTLLDALKIGVKPNDCFIDIKEPITI